MRTHLSQISCVRNGMNVNKEMNLSQHAAERSAAEDLWIAAERLTTVAAPRARLPEPSLDAGYRVQALNVERWRQAGRKDAGYKIAMTSLAVQRQVGVTHPTYGTLFADMICPSAAQIPHALRQARAEGEIAFIMGEDVLQQLSDVELQDAIAQAVPAIEVVDSRVLGWDVTAFDFVADNAAATFAVLGKDAIRPQCGAWKEIRMQLLVNEQLRSSGKGSDCLGSPLAALQWLSQHLIERGQHLKRGDVVMSGALGAAVAIQQGDAVEVRIDAYQAVRLDMTAEG